MQGIKQGVIWNILKLKQQSSTINRPSTELSWVKTLEYCGFIPSLLDICHELDPQMLVYK